MTSTVWTYGNNKLEVYKLAKGKVLEESTFPNNGLVNYELPTFKELDTEFNECGYELDGDVFGYRIQKASEVEQQDLPINIECFTKGKYKSDFLSKIAEDIKTYKMWDVSYK